MKRKSYYEISITFMESKVLVLASSKREALAKAESWDVEAEKTVVEDWRINSVIRKANRPSAKSQGYRVSNGAC